MVTGTAKHCRVSKANVTESSIMKSPLVVTSALTSADVNLTSGTKSPEETDGAVGSVTRSVFARFTSSFLHLHLSPPSKTYHLTVSHSLIFLIKNPNLTEPDEITDGKCRIKGGRRDTEAPYHCT